IMLGPVLLLFLGAGFFMPRKRRDLRLELFTLLFFLPQWAAAIAVLSPAPRYFMSPIIVLSTWSAAGMALAMARADTSMRGRCLRAAPVAAALVSMAIGTAVTLGAEHVGRVSRQPREYKAAGLWMREHLEPGL